MTTPCNRFLGRLSGFTLLIALTAVRVAAQEGVFLSGNDVPRAVFPDGDRFDRVVVLADEEIRARVESALSPIAPSLWEVEYVVFSAWRGETPLGRAFVVEEVGKHRPITFVIGVEANGTVRDTAVVAYREAYGGEIRNRRFLSQYKGKTSGDSVQPYLSIRNIAGATLSVEAASRAVKKALALSLALGAPAER